MIAKSVHPQSRQVVHAYGTFRGIQLCEVGYDDGRLDMEELKHMISKEVAAVVVQNPNFFGIIEPLDEIAELSHSHGALFITSVNPVSLAVLKPPGDAGADIAVGEGQSLGSPLSFGGPYLGFMATTRKLMRRMPGRIVGQTADTSGSRAFVLTIQTREQHIRREKATSNICTNQALNALAATVYLAVMGREGLKRLPCCQCKKPIMLIKSLAHKGAVLPCFQLRFDEFAVKVLFPLMS